MKWTRNEWAEIIGSLGAAALVGGYVRYSLQGELLLTSKILLIGGGGSGPGRDRGGIQRDREILFAPLLPTWHQHHDSNHRRYRSFSGS